jgi:hypothetical protein
MEEKDYSGPYQQLQEWVLDRVDQWEEHRNSNYQSKWDEYYRIWRGIWTNDDRTRQSEKSRLISPATQQAIEATVAELEEATFGGHRWFDVADDILDRNPQDIEYVRNLLHEDLTKDGVKDAVAECLLNGAIYGTGIGKVLVQDKIEIVPSEQPVPGTLTTMTETREVPYVCVKVESVSPKEFVIDPTATTINEALGVAQVVVKPRYIITKGMKDGIYNDMPLGNFDKADFGFDDEFSNVNNEDDKVKIVEYWGLVPKRFLKKNASSIDNFNYEDDELVEAVVTIANDSCVLRAAENPYMMHDRPFIAYQHDRVPTKFWGRGVAEKGYNPQKALDAELRARIDALALTTHPMMGLDATRLPRGTKFDVRPGKTILTNGDPKSVLMPLNFGSLSQSTFTEAAELERMVQMGTGAMDTANSNFANPRNSTASGMSMLQAASIKRQKRTLMNFQDSFLIPMINKTVWRKIQFDNERYPAVDFKFKAYSSLGIMAKELETTQMVQLLSMTPQGSPAFFVILTSIFENSSLSNRQQLVQAIQQMMQPNPEEQQVKQIEMQKSMLELEELKAEINKIYAEAQKLQVESGDKTSNETLAKKQLELAEKMVKIKGIQSETARNVPEVEHLNSEIVLNLAKAMNG